VPPRSFVVCLLLVVGAVVAPSASAGSIIHGVPRGKVVPRRAFALSAPNRAEEAPSNITYHGGPVVHRSTAYAIFWSGPSQTFPASFQQGIARFLGGVAADSGSHGNVYSTTAEYADTSAVAAYDSKFGGAYQDTTPLPTNGCSSPFGGPCVSEEQIVKEIDNFVGANGLPRGLHSMYLLFLPPGYNTCDRVSCAYTKFCGYHNSLGLGADTTLFAVLPWAAYAPTGYPMCTGPYSPHGFPALDGSLVTVSHEQIEILTNPVGGGWYDSTGQEIADKCAWTFGTPLGSSAFGEYNQQIGGDDYALQLEWSNAASGCVSHSDFVAPPPPANDSFAAAQALPGTDEGAASGTTFEATKETGEPNHAGNEGGASIWYSWTPQKFGLATVSTSGSNFDTVLGVYTGATVSNLTEVTSDDDGGFANRSSARFIARPGTTYRIAVDGSNTLGEPTGGEVRLDLSEAPPPQTRIRGHHQIATSRNRVRVGFRLLSNPAGTRFECSLDGRRFRRCGPHPRPLVAPGAHLLKARAVGPEGLRDPSSARFSFFVDRQ
jgi:hypothetical protein